MLKLPCEPNLMATRLDCVPEEMTNLRGYLDRLKARPAVQKAESVGR